MSDRVEIEERESPVSPNGIDHAGPPLGFLPATTFPLKRLSGQVKPRRAFRKALLKWRRRHINDGRPPFVHQNWDDRILCIIVDARRRAEDTISTHVPMDIPPECLYYFNEGQERAVLLAWYDEHQEIPDEAWRPARGWVDARSKDGDNERWVDLSADGGWMYIPSSYIHAGASNRAIVAIESGSPMDFVESVISLEAIEMDLTAIHPRKFAADAELEEYQRQVRPKQLVEEYEVAQRMIYLVIAAIIGAIVLLGIVLLGSPSGGGATTVVVSEQPANVEEISLPSQLEGGVEGNEDAPAEPIDGAVPAQDTIEEVEP